jgi:hypothetical protein
VFGERHLRHLLNSYQKYYNEVRTHLSLQKDAPFPRTIQTVGHMLAMPAKPTPPPIALAFCYGPNLLLPPA